MAEDVQHGRHNTPESKLYRMKATIFEQFMRQTDEFKSSIFTDGADQIVPYVAPPNTTPRPVAPVVLLEKPEALTVLPTYEAAPPVGGRDQARIDELKAQVLAAESALGTQRQALGEKESQVTQAGATRDQADALVKQRSAQLEGVRVQLQTAEQAVAEERANQQAQERAAQDTQLAVQAAGALVAGAQGELRDFAARVTAASQRVSGARVRVQESTADLEEKADALGQAEGEHARAVQRLSSAESVVQGLEQQNHEAIASVTDAQDRVAVMGVEVARLQALHALAEAAVAKYPLVVQAVGAFRRAVGFARERLAAVEAARVVVEQRQAAVREAV